MQEIVQIENNEAMTTSRQIAEVFGKKHTHVIDSIRKLRSKLDAMEQNRNVGLAQIEETTYIDSTNRERTFFKLNKTAMLLTVMAYQTEEALAFKLDYINQFDLMEEHIREQQSQQFFITETAEEQEKRIKLENSTRNANSRSLNAMYRWYKEGQLNNDMELMAMARSQVLNMYPTQAISTTQGA